jgi:hypothetical protein
MWVRGVVVSAKDNGEGVKERNWSIRATRMAIGCVDGGSIGQTLENSCRR